QLHLSDYFLRHDLRSLMAAPLFACFALSRSRFASGLHSQPLVSYDFSTCKKSNSTGVARPNIVTITFKGFRSEFTSSTIPVKLANGPSLIFTVSPFSNESFGFGLSAAVATR